MTDFECFLDDVISRLARHGNYPPRYVVLDALERAIGSLPWPRRETLDLKTAAAMVEVGFALRCEMEPPPP